MARPHLLVLAQEPVGERMAGAAIRAVELARAASVVADVVVASPGGGALDDLEVVAWDPHDASSLRAPLRGADIVYALPQWPLVMRSLRRSRARLVFDLYVPEYFETLEGFRGRRAPLRALMSALALDRLEDALHTGDLLLCASERQRDLLTGAMMTTRGLSVAAYDNDPALQRIAVVPFGVPTEPPRRSGTPGPRARFGAERVVLWNGGIWGWLDADTAIRAVLALDRPGVRLVVMGAADTSPARAATAAARGLVASLGAPVDFNDDWVPYDQRADWLLDSDVALSAHHDRLEARFAFRTRLLDCLWAGLPIVCTTGDDLAARVQREDLGAVAAPGDVHELAAGLAAVLDRGRDEYAPRLALAAAEMAWPRVAAPLLEFLAAPPPRREGRARTPHPARALRTAAYALARPGLNAAGLRGWPRA